MSRTDAIALAYLATIVTFIVALSFLSSPTRARLGNRIGAAGMVIAIAATLAQRGIHNYLSILIVMAVFAPIGAVAALLQHLAPDGELALDFEDEITAGACVTRREEAAVA